jgi:hypothetical protein
LARGQRDPEAIKLALKFRDPRELHAEGALHVLELLGNAAQDLGELDRGRPVLPRRPCWAYLPSWPGETLETLKATRTTRATSPTGSAPPCPFLRSFAGHRSPLC